MKLSDLFEKCSRKFSVKTVFMILIEIIKQVEKFHQQGLVSGNISIEDVQVVQTIEKSKIKLESNAFEVKPNEVAQSYPLQLFSSVNHDKGAEISYKSDLESLGYLAIYLLTGSLPWKKYCDVWDQNLSSKIRQIKTHYSWKMLSYGLPVEVSLFLRYIESLEEDSHPAYDV